MNVNGFINLYKKAGLTSNKALGILKYNLKENGLVCKIGHFGTLDPDAEGVLPVALGRATRLFGYSLDKVKQYKTIFRFGIDTDTLDASGKVLATEEKRITLGEVVSAMNAQVGEIAQIPPAYSAKSVNGVKAYKLARNGECPTLAAKIVTVFSVTDVKELSENRFAMTVCCSGGTYIRSMARDAGRFLDTYCIMEHLVREKSGAFSIENSVPLSEIEGKKDLLRYILPLDTVLHSFESYDIDEDMKKFLLDGKKKQVEGLPKKDFCLYCNGLPVGIAHDAGFIEVKTWLI